MSRLFTYVKTADSLDTASGSVTLDQSIDFSERSYKLRLITASISTNLPNVFNYNGIHNNIFRFSLNGGTDWSVVSLDTGIYDLELLTSALANVMAPDLIDPLDPAILFSVNPATQRVYIEFRKTKLTNPANLVLDIAYQGSLFYKLIGFTTPDTIIPDPSDAPIQPPSGTVYTVPAPNYAQLDWWGVEISVQIYGFGDISVRNNSSSFEIGRIVCEKDGGVLPLKYRSPDTQSTVYVDANPSRYMSSYQVKFIGIREDREILIFDGEAYAQFEIVES